MESMNEYLELKGSRGTRIAYRAGISEFLRFIYGLKHPPKVHYSPEEAERNEALSSRYLEEVQEKKRDPARDLIAYAGHLHHRPAATGRAYISGVTGWFVINDIELSDKKLRLMKGNLPKGKPARYGKWSFDLAKLRRVLLHADPMLRTAILVLASSGMRDGELLALLPSDVDLTRSPARVRIREEITKTGTERITYLSTEASRALDHWLKHERARYMEKKMSFLPKGMLKTMIRQGNPPDEDKRIFPLSHSTFLAVFGRTVARAGFVNEKDSHGRRHIKPHQLRAFFRSEFPKVGGNGRDIAEILMGHEGYLTRSYVDLPKEEELEKIYRQAERYLTIEAPVQVSEKELETVREENRQLQERIDLMERVLQKEKRAQESELYEKMHDSILAQVKKELGISA